MESKEPKFLLCRNSCGHHQADQQPLAGGPLSFVSKCPLSNILVVTDIHAESRKVTFEYVFRPVFRSLGGQRPAGSGTGPEATLGGPVLFVVQRLLSNISKYWLYADIHAESREVQYIEHVYCALCRSLCGQRQAGSATGPGATLAGGGFLGRSPTRRTGRLRLWRSEGG